MPGPALALLRDLRFIISHSPVCTEDRYSSLTSANESADAIAQQAGTARLPKPDQELLLLPSAGLHRRFTV
jgi:hypothetical protein